MNLVNEIVVLTNIDKASAEIDVLSMLWLCLLFIFMCNLRFNSLFNLSENLSEHTFSYSSCLSPPGFSNSIHMAIRFKPEILEDSHN